MQFSWLTFFAQIINFLVLVLLLKRFLYGPIVRMMKEREVRIATELSEAAAKEEEAKREAAICCAERREIEDHRGEMISRAQVESEQLKKELLAKVRREAEESKLNWQRSLAREQEVFFQELKRRAGQEVYQVARRVLHDLASAELERQIVAIFLKRLRQLDARERQQVAAELRRRRAAVYSAFALDQQQRREVARVIAEQIAPDLELDFDLAPDLICGVELRIGGWKAAWSLADYLEGLDEELAQAFAGKGGAAKAPADSKLKAANNGV